MATITNTIQNNIVTTGGQTAVRDVDNLGRAQTRMGQASASAGRSFAAQSQGLGGLVGAYAGAAATVFALQAAFEALSKAAQAENIVKGTSALAAEIGQSGPKILKSIKEITQGQLTLEEASNAANLALSSGFNTGQIEDLAKVALGASRALGRNLTDAMTRVVRGAAKMEPELLDELGIFTRIEPAVNAYAAKMNIAATTMTDFERRQAFLNAVIEEGTRKFSNIDTTSKTTQKSLEQLSVQITELGTAFGQVINKYLIPVVDFFKNDFGNTILLFLGVLTLVFAKGGQILGAFAAQGITKLSALSSKMADFSASMGRLDLSTVENSAQTARNEAYERDPTTGRQGSFNPRIAGRTSEQQATLTRAIAAQRDGTLSNVSAIEANNRVLTENRDNLQRNSPRWTYLNTLVTANTTALQSSNRAGRAFLITSRALESGVRGLGVAFSFLGKAISGIFAGVAILQLAGTLFDRDFLGDILDAFNKNTEAAARMREGFIGVSESLSGNNSLAKQFENLLQKSADIEKIPDRLIKIKEALDNPNIQLTEPGNAGRLGMAELNPTDRANTGGGRGIGVQISQMTDPNADLGQRQQAALTQNAAGDVAQLDILKFENSELVRMADNREKILDLVRRINTGILSGNDYLRTTSTNYLDQTDLVRAMQNAQQYQLQLQIELTAAGAGRNTTLEKQIASDKKILDLETQISAAVTANNLLSANELRAQLALEKSVNKLIEERLDTVSSLIGGVANATGQSLKSVTGSVRKLYDDMANSVEVFGVALKKVNGEFVYGEQTEEVRNLIDSFAIADGTLTTLSKAFDDGSTSSQAMSKGIFGIRSELEEMRKAGKQYSSDFKGLEDRLNDLVKINDQLKRTEKLSKALSDAFKAPMKAIDMAVTTGDMDLTGSLAKTEEDRVKNQRDLLILQQDKAKLLEIEKEAYAENAESQIAILAAFGDPALAQHIEKTLKLNEDQQAVEEAGVKSRKAAQGIALELIKSTEKLLKTEKRRELVLTQKLQKIERENELVKQTLELELEKLKITGKQAAAQRQINVLKEQVKTQQIQLKQNKALVANTKSRTAFLLEQDAIMQRITDNEVKRGRLGGGSIGNTAMNGKLATSFFESGKGLELFGQAGPDPMAKFSTIERDDRRSREGIADNSVSGSSIERSLARELAGLEELEKNRLITNKELRLEEKRVMLAIHVEEQRLIGERRQDQLRANRNEKSNLARKLKLLQEEGYLALVQAQTQQEINDKNLAIFDQEKQLEAKKLSDSLGMLDAQRKLDVARNRSQLDDIEAQKALLAFDKTALQTQVALRKADIQFVNKFAEAVNSMGEIVTAYVAATIGPNQPIPTTPVVGTISGDLIAGLEEANALIVSNADLQKNALTAQRKGLVAQFSLDRKIYKEKRSQLLAQIEDQESLTIAERQNLLDNQKVVMEGLAKEREAIYNKIKLNKLLTSEQIEANEVLLLALDEELKLLNTNYGIQKDRLALESQLKDTNTYMFDLETNLLNLQLQNSQKRLDISQKELQIQKQKRDFALSEKLANQGLEDEIRNALGMSDELSKLKSFMATKDDKLGAAGADRSDEIKIARTTASVATQALGIQRRQFELDKIEAKRQFQIDIRMLNALNKLAGNKLLATTDDPTQEQVIGLNDTETRNKLEQLYRDTEAAMAASLALQSGAIAKQQELETDAANQKYAATKSALDREQQLLELYASNRYQLYVKVNEAINQGVGDLINKIFDNIAEGKSIKDGLGDIFKETFTNIRKGVLEQTLIKPAKQAMSSITSSLFGFDVNETKGADNATVSGNGELHVKVMNGEGGGGKGEEADPLASIKEKGKGFMESFQEKAMGVFSRMKEGIGNFGNTAMETFGGLGKSLSNMIGGEGGIMKSLSGFMQGLTGGGGEGIGSSLFNMGKTALSFMGFGGAATGGLVGMTGVRNMASGGQVNALRDRVPAMLEPGEFVIRKPAAKSIGNRALGQMNATGAAGMGNVQFNIVNEGEPKSAEQQGQPKFDADKIVIDVVMRDLQSNGPIRNAMRNG